MQQRPLQDGRVLLDSGSAWEPRMGYSRAVRAGDRVLVAGCVGLNPDGTYPGDLATQTQRCVERIEAALQAFDLDLSHVIRVRLYTTRIESWPEIATVMGPRFAETRPANTLLGVAALVDPKALIEIEAEAWCPASRLDPSQPL